MDFRPSPQQQLLVATAREYLRRQPVGPTLDVYSLGVTLWLAVTGEELWEGASEAQLVRHIIEETVPPPSQFVKIAPQIESVILRACAPEPASTTFSPGSRRRRANGLATPAKDSTAASGMRATISAS